MSNGYQKSNGCNADKEGGKFFKTFFYPNAQSKHVCPLAYNSSITLPMRIIILILTALLFIGCSQRARCIRAYERCGPLWRTDTLEFFDSVIIDRAIHDTVFNWQTLQVHDTVTIERNRMRVRIVRLPGDSFWVQGECKDTVIRYVTQRVTVAGPRKGWPWGLWIAAAGLFIAGWKLSRRR